MVVLPRESVTRDLISSIIEFLSFHDFPKTIAAMHEERTEKRAVCSSSIGHRITDHRDHRDRLRTDMVRGKCCCWRRSGAIPG